MSSSQKKRSASEDAAPSRSNKKAKKIPTSLSPTVPKDAMSIISDLRYIQSLSSYEQSQERLEAERLRPEWFEFRTNWGHGPTTVRNRIKKLLEANPTLTKKALLEATGIATTGQITKFLTKHSRRGNVSCSAETHLCTLVNILEHMTESSTKRKRRLQMQLENGLGYGVSRGYKEKWPQDKLDRFRAAFPDIEISRGKENSSDKKSAGKDPNAPRRNRNAYLLFSQAKKEERRKEMPGASLGLILQEISAQWKGLSAEERAKWDDAAEADKLRYEMEMEAYKKKSSS